MRNKLILFLMLALFGSTSFLRADQVVIGDGTATTYYAPFNSLWGYSFVEQVYLADEIGTAGTINSISFNMRETDAAFTSEFDIFMKNVSRDAFASGTDFESVVAGDIVYSGSVTFQPGWTTITLDTPFAYDGTSNLMVGVHEKTSGYSTRYFYYTAVTGGLISGHSDSVDPNPYDMGSYTGTTYTQNYRSNIILDITPGGGGGGGVAGELTVHDASNTNSYVPVYGFYADAYLKCEMVYPAAELADMANGTINSIKFYASTPASEAWTSTWQVFVSEVADATISDFYGPGTVVYEGALDGTQAEMEITFTTPYAYNGGNLLIGVYNITTGNYKSVTWAGETVDGASVSGYNYSSLSGISATQRNFLPKTTFAYVSGSTPVPPVPTDPVAITPNPFDMGFRPLNGWMEPMVMRIHNGLETSVTMTGNLSNTAGVNAFVMSEEVEDVVLEPGEDFTAEIDINPTAPVGDYTEQFTLFYIENDRDITLVPVTATFYTAGEADIVETAKVLSLSYTGGVANFSHTPADLHANYFDEYDDIDAVYSFNLAKDSKFSVTGGEFIGIYNYVADFQPTLNVEPVVASLTGELDEEILVAGQYYMIIAGNTIGTVEGTVEQLPAPSELVALLPEDGATEVESPVTLTWEGGENAAQYRVLFGTSPVNMPAVLDWTVIDENYGSYTVTSLDANTQYFWQIQAKNSNGTVQTVRRGFTTTLTAPNNVTASDVEIFTDGSTLIKWKHSSGSMGDLDETQIGSGTATNSYLPTYNLYNYSLSEQIYTSEELGGEAGYINSISFHPVGAITRDLKIYMANTDKETFTSGSDWVAMTAENLVFEGNVNMVANTWVTIEFAEPFEYEGENIILAVTDHTGTWTSSIQYSVFDAANQAINVYQDSAPYSALAPAGSGTVRNFKNQIIINKDGAKNRNRDFLGYNVYYGSEKANDELITEKQYLLTNLPYNMEDGHDINVTAVYNEGESGHSTPIVTVRVSGYGTFTGTVKYDLTNAPIAGANVKFAGKDEFQNNVAFEGTTDANGVYTINNVKAGLYTGTATIEGMEPKTSDPVTLAYAATETVDFVMHEVYVPVLSVVAEEMDPELARVRWSLNVNIPVPNPGGNTPGGGGSASSFTEGFESGMPAGWTVIDGNNDGWTWCLTSAIPSTWTYYASLSLDWYRTGTNAICSGSYINGVGALTPNEYLVMGQQNLVNGSTLSFWAAATDASYPADHFGVFVSDDATNWTSVQEWTLTAKGGAHNGGRESRDGNGAKLGTWYNYSVDLSAYAGQKYIAIRHFNCTDQYIMVVDDIELSASKGTRDVATYDIYRAAILTEDGEPLNVADIEDPSEYYIGTVAGPDTLYADFAWANQEPGLYQYGVAANYPTPAKGGNRGEVVIDFETGDFSQFPQYTQGTSYPWTVVDGGHNGKAMKSSNSGVSSSTSEISATFDFPTDGNISFWALCMGEGTSTIWDKCIFELDGTQMFSNGANVSGWNEYNYPVTAGEHTMVWKYSKDSSVNPTGDYMMVDDIVFTFEGGGSGNDDPETPVTWSNVLPKDIETTVILNAQVPDASAEGATVRFDNTFENTTFTVTLDETGTDTITDFRKGEYIVTFHLDGYTSDFEAGIAYSIWNDTEITAVFEEIFKPITTINASRSGYVTWDAVIPVDRVAENYIVRLDGAEYAETAFNFIQIDEDDLNVGQTYVVGVAVMYTTGISEFVYTNFTYADCTGAEHQVEDLTATNDPGNTNVTLAWNGATPTPPTPPTPPTGGWTEGFEGGLNGWTVLTLNADGGEWLHSNNNPGGYDYSSHAHGGSGFAMCYSFVDYVGAFNTDSYLITPQMNSVSAGSTLTFWADNANDSYPESFSVCVSTAANPSSASDFTTVWSGGAKGTGDGAMVRHNNNRYDNWRSHTIDLSAYAGQNVWIAFHDVNYDMYEVWIDDVEFTTAAKLDGTFAAAGLGYGATTAPTDDGNWYYYDNGSNDDAIGLTSGGSFYWGIMFPAGTYEGNRLTKISYFDYTAHTGNIIIYQGGTSAPQTQLYTQAYSVSGTQQYVEIAMEEPVEVDNTQPLWVVMRNNNGQYVAAIDAGPGVNYGSCLSMDGSSWYTMVNQAAASLDGNWNLRAYVESGSGPAPSGLVPNKYNIFVDGELVGATASNTFTYDATDFVEHEYVVLWVDADYLESCVIEGENLIYYAAAPLGIAESMVNSTLYPNPTDGDIRINANNMERISIVNALGQVVYDKAVEGNEAIINMAQFGNGVYMVNIATENGTSVKRVIVSK